MADTESMNPENNDSVFAPQDLEKLKGAVERGDVELEKKIIAEYREAYRKYTQY